MKSIISTLFLSLFLVVGFGQKRPDQFTEETSPTDANFEVYSQKNGQVRRASLGNLKKYFTPDVNTTDITYIPATTGNTLNLMEFVKNAGDSIYYIDSSGDAFLLRDPNASGGGSTELADGVTIIGDGTTGNELRADTTNKIATKADLSNKIDRNTITRTFYDVDSSYVFTVNDNYENDVLISVDTILRQCDGCDVGQDIQYNYSDTLLTDTSTMIILCRDVAKTNCDTVEVQRLRDVVKGGYAVLRSLSSRLIQDEFFLEDWETTDWQGNTCLSTGGTFRKVSAGIENGGTVIVSTDGTIYQRQFDGITIHPEWWECKGYDIDATNYVDAQTSSDGIANDNDRLNAASNIAGEGGVILLGDKIKTFDIDIVVPVFKNQKWEMNYDTIRRANTDVVTYTGSGNTLTLSDASSFRVGQKIIIIDPSATYGGQGIGENNFTLTPVNNFPLITNITGNVVTLSASLDDYPVGGLFMRFDNMMGQQVGDYGAIEINRGFFDGNATNGGNILFTNPNTGFQSGLPADWRYGYTILLGSSSNNAQINNCTFVNTPAENTSFAKGNIVNSKYSNLGGSFTHISSATDDIFAIWVDNCRGVGSNLVTDEIMGHSEGTITFSNRPYDCKITNCDFRNGGGHVVGELNAGGVQPGVGYNLRLSNNYFENFAERILQSGGTDVSNRSYFLINDNEFVNCYAFVLQGNPDYKKDIGVKKIINIKDNDFVNTRLQILFASKVVIQDNSFYYDSTYQITFTDANDLFPSSTNAQTTSAAWLNIGHCNGVDIIDNRFYNNYDVVDEDRIGVAVSLSLSQGSMLTETSYDENGTETDYYYMQNVRVQGNLIWGFRDGIRTGSVFQTQNTQFLKQVLNWDISNNQIVMSKKYTGVRFGIETAPGSITSNNTIWLGSTDVVEYGIWVQGIHPDGAGNETRLLGSIVKDNIIIGNNQRAVQVGGSVNQYNSIVINNLLINNVTQALYDTSLGNSYLNSNDIITNAELSFVSGMPVPEFHYFEANKNHY